MARTSFYGPGMAAPVLPGVPAGTRGNGNGVLSPGCTEVNGFDAAKDFVRAQTGFSDGGGYGYVPLDRPGRRAERIATPDAPTKIGISEL
jgi:hypothetical protein